MSIEHRDNQERVLKRTFVVSQAVDQGRVLKRTPVKLLTLKIVEAYIINVQ